MSGVKGTRYMKAGVMLADFNNIGIAQSRDYLMKSSPVKQVKS